MDMGAPLSKEVQLISFHTVSKGYWGECGQRGGYFEMTNIPPRVCVPDRLCFVYNLYFKSLLIVFLVNVRLLRRYTRLHL